MTRPADKSAARRAAAKRAAERQAGQVTRAAETITAAGTTDAARKDKASAGTAEAGTAAAGSAAAGPAAAGTAKAGTAEAGTAEAGTAEAGTAEAGTAEAGTAAAGTAKAGTAEAGRIPVGGAADGAAAFAAALGDFTAGRDEQRDLREDFTFEEVPPPKRLAPYAAAIAATAHRDGIEVAWGRLIVLYDPDGQQGWRGTFRLIAYVRADVEPEMAADPLLGEVGWSWLTDALGTHAPGYEAPSGTVTRVITEGFGAKEDEDPLNGFELRASWSPEEEPDLGAHVAAWCELVAAAAGLPPQPGTRAFRPGSARRRR